MQSIGFPNIFNSTYTNISEEDSTSQNIRLLLNSNVRTFFGDPGFGADIRRFLFDPNSKYLTEVIEDELRLCLKEFIPQIQVPIGGITVKVEKNVMYIEINCIKKSSGEQNTYKISLTETDLT